MAKLYVKAMQEQKYRLEGKYGTVIVHLFQFIHCINPDQFCNHIFCLFKILTA